MKIVKEFKEFAVKGNVVDMGVGIVIGTAFTSIVQSLVKDIFTPFLSLLTVGVNSANWFIVLNEGKIGGPYVNLAAAQADAAVTLNIGHFFNASLSFAIVAIVLFFFIKTINRLKISYIVPAEPVKVTADSVKTKECPHCFTVVSVKATRCPNCTSDIKTETSAE